MLGLGIIFQESLLAGYLIAGGAILGIVVYTIWLFRTQWSELFWRRAIPYCAAALAFAVFGGLVGFKVSGLFHGSMVSEADLQLTQCGVDVSRCRSQLSREEQRSEGYLSYIERNLGSDERQRATASSPSKLLGPVNLVTRPGVDTPDRYREAISRLRQERGLRELTEDELGLQLLKSPRQSYFFVIVALVNISVSQNLTPQIFLSQKSNYPQPPSEDICEMHKLANGDFHLVVFLNESDAARISSLSGNTDHSVTAYPYWSESRSVLVSIPVDRIVESKDRRMAQMALDLVIR